MKQAELFETIQSTRSQSWEKFVAEHPFQYHRLIVRDGVASHHNTLYKNYNATDEELKECDGAFTKRIICTTPEGLLNAVLAFPATNKQTLYILTPLDWPVVKSILGSRLYDNN